MKDVTQTTMFALPTSGSCIHRKFVLWKSTETLANGEGAWATQLTQQQTRTPLLLVNPMHYPVTTHCIGQNLKRKEKKFKAQNCGMLFPDLLGPLTI